MAFKLRVVFEGVFAFVPDTPFFVKNGDGTWKSGNTKQVWVLAPDLRKPDLADWDRESHYVSPDFRSSHFAIASVAPKCVKRKSRSLFKRQIASHNGGGKELVLAFKGVHLGFKQADKPLGGDFRPNVTVPHPDHQTSPTGLGTTAKEWASLWWLPRIGEIAPDYSYARKSLRPSCGKNPAPRELAAVLSIDSGTLSIGKHNGQPDAANIWTFTKVARKGDGVVKPDECFETWNRAIGNQVVWETTVDESRLELQATFPTGRKTQIKLAPPFFSRVVEIFLRNREPEFVLFPKERGALPLNGEDRVVFDADFQEFFKLGLAAAEPPTRRYPYDKSAGAGTDDKPCASGSYQGFS